MKKGKKTKNKIKFITLLKVVATLVVIALLVYLIMLSVAEYNRQAEVVGIVVCKDDECIKTMHIHSDITFDLCGNDTLVLPREVGPLSGLHTHKEPNYLHFHDQVTLDPETRDQLFDERLSINEVIRVFSLNAQEYCGTDNIEIAVLVNDQVPPEGLDYNWKDGDDIKLMYRAK